MMHMNMCGECSFVHHLCIRICIYTYDAYECVWRMFVCSSSLYTCILYIYTCVCVYIHICMRTWMYTCIHVHVHVPVPVLTWHDESHLVMVRGGERQVHERWGQDVWDPASGTMAGAPVDLIQMAYSTYVREHRTSLDEGSSDRVATEDVLYSRNAHKPNNPANSFGCEYLSPHILSLKHHIYIYYCYYLFS